MDEKSVTMQTEAVTVTFGEIKSFEFEIPMDIFLKVISKIRSGSEKKL